MTSQPAEYFCNRFTQLQSIRSPFDMKWRDIAKFMRPVRDEIGAVYSGQPLPPESNVYVTSGIAALALDNFVGGIYGYLSNEANAWASLATFDDDLNKSHRAKQWLATCSRRILNSYGPAVSSFYAQIPELYADVPSFGSAGFLSEMKPDRRNFHDQAFSPFDLYFDTNDYQEVDTVYRPMWFTKRMCVQKFGADNLPDRVQKMRDDDRTQILHVVAPNDEYTDGMIGPKGFPFSDLYVYMQDKVFAKQGGRYDNYQTPRWSGNNIYGYGLGQRVLPDVKTHNAMDRSLLENAEWQAHPSQLLPDRNMVGGARMVPRKPMYGGMSMGGKPLAQFLAPAGNIGITHEMHAARAEQIRESFFFGLMQMVGRSGMTTVEVMQRDEERMRLLGPHLGRILVEFVSKSFTQRFSILWRNGWLPEPPPELQGHMLKINYVSPMANAQKSAAASGTLRLIDATIALSGVKPEAADNLDEDAALHVLREGFSAPPEVLRSPEARDALRKAREQRAMQQDALTMGQQGADIAQKMGIAQPRNMGMKAA